MKKLFKKRKLLKKYKLTPEKMEEQMSVVGTLQRFGDKRGEELYIHKVYCEIRCYNRLLKL